MIRRVVPPIALLSYLLLSSALSPAWAEHNALTTEELDAGWILLFDGESTFGWKPTGDANWAVEEGVVSVSEGDRCFLVTTTEFGDFEFLCDLRCPASTNSGVFLRMGESPGDITRDCYELNIAGPGVSPFTTGGFVNRLKATDAEHTGDWQTFHVTAVGGRLTVDLDGKRVLEYNDPHPKRRGRIGLQHNSGPVAFRNIKLKPLGLEPIFDGETLEGWNVFPDRPSEFSVTQAGELQIVNGPGQIESEAEFGDFVLQMQVFVAGEHLNSGVFFRAIPGGFWQGYESQIRNEYEGNDRGSPVDFGTGGIYRRQPSRRVVADDFAWFHKTIIADGAHMAVWVEGVQVSDWIDERPASDNAREGLRTAPGVIQLQGHDPTTSLRFREIQAAELPPAGE